MIAGLSGEMAAALEKELRSGQLRERVISEAQKVTMGKAGRKSRRSMDGIGRHMMSVDPASYHYWRKMEPGCWEDADFQKRYLRDNPQCKVESTGVKTQFGYERAVKFSKVYVTK